MFPFTFYYGPPTANGKPHIGHVETRTIKDMIPRYQTMKGKFVPRKAGWDTHLDFVRVKNIAPGETRHVALEIPVEELRFYDVISRRLMVEEGTYEIYAGASCKDKAVSTEIFIPGGKRGGIRREDRSDQCGRPCGRRRLLSRYSFSAQDVALPCIQ